MAWSIVYPNAPFPPVGGGSITRQPPAGALVFTGSAPTRTISGPITRQPPAGALIVTGSAPSVQNGNQEFFTMPSLADEQAWYDSQSPAWTWTESDKSFTGFASDPGAITDVGSLHNDTEGDDLWMWYAKQRRGVGGIVSTWVSRYLTYFKNFHLSEVQGEDLDVWCHAYASGLCWYGHFEGDSAALDAAVAIGNFIKSDRYGNDPVDFQTGEMDRETARHALIFSHLSQAVGGSWNNWRDAAVLRYNNASNWAEAPTHGLRVGGFYHAPEWYAANNWNGYTQAMWNAGIRLHQPFEMGIQVMAMLPLYIQTGNSTLRDRIIKFARFIKYYGHDPFHTVPLAGSRMGHDDGSWWHEAADNSANAVFDASWVNLLVWGFKLTNDRTFLDMAKKCLRNATQWEEGYPGGGHVGPLVADNVVERFIDTRANNGFDIVFERNKGVWQYAYWLFENASQSAPNNLPTVKSTLSQLETQAKNLAVGSWAQITGVGNPGITADYDSSGSPGSGNWLEYQDDLHYDPIGRRIYATGSDDRGDGRHTVYYDLDANAWTLMTGNGNPYIVQPGTDQGVNHGYGNQAFDQARRRWYVGNGTGQNMYCFDAIAGSWSSAKTQPNGYATAPAMCHFPEQDALYYFNTGAGGAGDEINVYRRADNAANNNSFVIHTSGLAGGAHVAAHYSRTHKCIIFAGGDGDNTAVYRLNKDNTITTLADAPIGLHVHDCEWVEHPTDGVFHVYINDSGTKRRYSMNPSTGAWVNIGLTNVPAAVLEDSGHPTRGLTMIAGCLPEFRIQVFLSANGQDDSQLWIYRYA